VTAFEGAWSYGEFDERLAQLIHLFKYAKIQTLDRPLGGLLIKGLPPGLAFDVTVPVPLHPWKRLVRGFNQSELLARELSRRTAIPMADALRRTRNTATQAGLTASHRRQNVAGAFAARNAALVAGKRVLLIDDVMTTGVTLAAASRALRQAGALRVTVLTLARADRRQPQLRFAQFSKSLTAASGAT
jgi:ComF family protein